MSAVPTNPRAQPRERSWLPVWVLALGLGSIVTMLVSDHFRHRTILRNEAHLQAACELRVEVALAHLWLEEYVTGDETPHDAIEHARLAREIAAALLDGNPTDPSDTDPEPITAPPLREQVAGLAGQLETFETVSRERKQGYEQGRDVGIGSEIDRQYDDVFARVFARAGILEHALGEQMERDKQRSRRVFTGILAVWGVLTLAAAFGLRTRERRRLAAEVALRTSEAQLLQSQKMDALGRLAGGIAHDINNYLAAIRGHCELVQMKLSESDPIARKMAASVATIGKASALIQRLLAFGRRQPTEPQVIDLNRVVHGLEKMMQPSIGEKIRLMARLAPVLWHVEADPAQLEQVIVNLIVNARDAMPLGGTITLETANQHAGGRADETGEQVVLRVRDTGCGIPPEAFDRIFEPFWTTKGPGTGNGLGLAIVYRIVTQNGGRVAVASEPGIGTEFTVRLPRSRKPLSRESEAPRHPEMPAGGQGRILLVDDNQDFRDATRDVLESLGYTVRFAADAEEALAIGDGPEGSFDLVITDVVMPGLSGPELIAQLAEHQPVKALFISGYTDDVALENGVDRRRVTFLKKPFSTQDLAREVQELMTRKSSTGSSRDAERGEHPAQQPS